MTVGIQRILGSEAVLCDIIMMDICHYIFVKTQRIHYTPMKTNVNCGLWGENDVAAQAYHLLQCTLGSMMLIVEEAMHTSGYKACGKSLYFLLSFVNIKLLYFFNHSSRAERRGKRVR